MKRLIFLLVLICGLALPSALMAQSSDHVEVGAFADYMNFSATDPHINFVGVGGRAAFNVHPNVQLEAEMSYDFKRNFTSVFSNGVTTQFVNTNLRPLTALVWTQIPDQFGTVSSLCNRQTGLHKFQRFRSERAGGFRRSPGRHSDRGHPFRHVSRRRCRRLLGSRSDCALRRATKSTSITERIITLK